MVKQNFERRVAAKCAQSGAGKRLPLAENNHIFTPVQVTAAVIKDP
jgi:hypothetical protein